MIIETGDRPRSSAAAYTNGLKADPGCRRLRTARLNGVDREIGAADHGEQVAGLRIHRDERRLQALRPRRLKPSRTAASAASWIAGTKVVRTFQSGGLSPP